MPEADRHPWLRLLELEVTKDEPEPTKRRRGRPKNPFPRKRVRSSLTEDEKAALDELVELLSEHLGRSLHRGHLIAFMTFRLRDQLRQDGELVLDDDIDSFVDLAEYLDERGR